jgi:3',5'-cyclic-AMP phosphodiesterase
MYLIEITQEELVNIPYLSARTGGGVEVRSLSVKRGWVQSLPEGLHGLLVTSDLQGVVRNWQTNGVQLLGEVVAETLADLGETGEIPLPERIGVLLAGDLYSSPEANRRGASGDVRSVWTAFASLFRWVAGVLGNHDSLGTAAEARRLNSYQNLAVLDGNSVEFDSLKIGGVGLITGNPKRYGRRDSLEHLAKIDRVCAENPDILLLHEGPVCSRDQRGHPEIAERISQSSIPLTVCGHVFWPEPLGTLDPAHQVLNVDSRAVLLMSAS